MPILQFLDAIRTEPAVISFHSLGDLDSVGSAFALKLFLKNASIVASDTITAQCKRLMAKSGLPLDKNAPENARLIVVDCNSQVLMGRFRGREAYAVIDHHSAHADPIKSKYAYADAKRSSTCEIVYEFLRERKIKPDPTTATLLVAGMIADSAHFANADQRTFSEVAELLEISKTNYRELVDLIDAKPDVSYRMALIKAVQDARITRAGNFIIATSQVQSYEAGAADALLELGGDAVFVGCSGRDARISARTHTALAKKINLPQIMGQAGKILGGSGGGHDCAAGADGPNIQKLREALELCERLARERLEKA